jgi:putative endonuclease
MPRFLYLIECADGSVYTGIAVDVEARFEKHLNGTGARYTRSRKPLRVLASFELADRSSALRAEYRVKRLPAPEKRALAAGVRTLESVMPQTVVGQVGIGTETEINAEVEKQDLPGA